MRNDCNITQKQNLSINNKILQSIEILQMNSEDIEYLLSKASEENPFIEVSYNRNKSSNYKNFVNVENIICKKDLKSHLITQINTSGMNHIEKKIARYITFLLNEDGYITITKHEIAANLRLSLVDIEKIFEQLYNLDPAGAYSQSLSECLRIQLIDLGYYNETYRQILERLDLVGEKKIKKLSEVLNIPYERILKKVEIIQKLNPCPGQNFNANEIYYLKPELNVYIDEANNIAIEPFEYYDSSYHINDALYKSLENYEDKSTKRYYNDHYRYAKWLLRAVENRNNTLIRVVRAIAEEQYDFFQEGVGLLKPLTLKNIAKKIEMHESTISRVTNKSIMTKFGVFCLKYFFSSEIKSLLYDNTYSSTAIKGQIKKLISSENNKTPLSDRALTEILNARGIKISRRTVAKYRDEMKITDSYKRVEGFLKK